MFFLNQSWPAQVYLRTSYENLYYFDDYNITDLITQSSGCAGTLIDRTTVLTAAHCLIKKFDLNLGGIIYSLDVELNEKYPTYESMLTVYLGINNVSDINSNSPTIVKMNVTEIKIVIFFKYYLI